MLQPHLLHHAARVIVKNPRASPRKQLDGQASSARTSTAGGNLKEWCRRNWCMCATIERLCRAQDGGVVFTTDETVLAHRACRAAPRLLSCRLHQSRNVGFALRKTARFKAALNQALLDLEASGEAAKIWDTWFGPATAQPIKRSFRINAEY